MRLNFLPMDDPAARKILCWRYDPPYDIYNPDPNHLESDVAYYTDPLTACYQIIGEGEDLVGFCTFGLDGRVPGGDYRAEALDIGLGIRPDLTGQGKGAGYVRAVLDFAREKFAPPAFRVTIAAFNTRAQRTWEKAGFRRVQRFREPKSERDFFVLTRSKPKLVSNNRHDH